MLLFEKVEKDTQNKNRVFNYYSCDYCKEQYKKQKRFSGSKQENYCSIECYTEDVSRIKVNCAHCNVLFSITKSRFNNSKSGLYFCCRNHKDIGQSYISEIQPEHYGTGSGINSYRKIALDNLPNKCIICNYDNLDALEVHHKDKDRNNNTLSNLEIVCCNCHTLIHKNKI